MSAIRLYIHKDNPQKRLIQQVVDVLKNDGVIIYPTDTVYAIGCSIYSQKAIEKICKIRQVKVEKTQLSFICNDLTNISYFAKISNNVFKVLKRNLPGPFTFILEASSEVPKILKQKKKTVGIRIPNHLIPRMIVEELGAPIITTSLKIEDDINEYPTDPDEIYDSFYKQIDVLIDAGFGGNTPSAVVDCTGEFIEIVRSGFEELVL